MALMKRRVNMIVIHCSATREDKDYTFEDCIRDHKARGFRQCGYHYYIRKDGTIHIGRILDDVGAHAGKGYNQKSIGICYEGGLDSKGKAKDTRTAKQKQSILICIDEARDYGNITTILGHRDLSPDLDSHHEEIPAGELVHL
jgi:N-acetylmuramoyl-L-alanine amidase